MNIRKILEGLNYDKGLIDDIDSLICFDNYQCVKSVDYEDEDNNKRISIVFKSKIDVDEESTIEIINPSYSENPNKDESRITIFLNEFFNKETQKFIYESDYSFDFVPSIGITKYSVEHQLCEVIDEDKEERVILNQNNYNMFLRSTYYSRWFNEETFNKNISNVEAIKLGKEYFINAINRDRVLDEDRPLSLRIK